MYKAIIIGGDHHNTLGVIRALGYKGIKPTVVLVTKAEKSYIGHSKYISTLIKVDSEEGAFDYLLENRASNRGTIVIACSDGASSILDMNRDQLKEYYSLPGAAIQGRITSVMDKQAITELGKSVGFEVPDSWVVDRDNPYIEDVVYPCITKPLLSISGQKSAIKICSTKDELLDALQNGVGQKFQVQQFLDKDFEYQLIGLSINAGENIVIPGCSRCIRPCPGTNTGFLHYVDLGSINPPIGACKKFIQEVGYSGLFSLEFLRDKEGRDYFMEMNFRNDGNAICVIASGTNLPYLWYMANAGLDYKRELENSTFKPVYVMPEFADFKNFVANRKISLWKWLKDIAKTDCFMEFDKRDPKPFFFFLYNKLSSLDKLYKIMYQKFKNLMWGGKNDLLNTSECYEIACLVCGPQYGYTNGRIAA